MVVCVRGVCPARFLGAVYGYFRLFRGAGFCGGRMHYFHAIARRLTPFLALAVLLFPWVAMAGTTCGAAYQTQAQAMAACQAFLTLNANPPYNNAGGSCTDNPTAGGVGGYVQYSNATGGYGAWEYCGGAPPPPSPNVCQANAPSGNSWHAGKILHGYQTDLAVVDPTTGVAVNCRMSLDPTTPPLSDGNGNWFTYMHVGPQGDSADGTPLPAPGGQISDSTGAPVSPAPGSLPASASSVAMTPAPQVCGGASCYDPSTGTACGVVNGSQVCVQGPPTPAQPGGNCFTAGDGSLCMGNPPPPPSSKAISDPATQIKGSDNYTMADPTTGQNATQTVNLFAGAGGTVSNGAKPGAIALPGSAPASSSSAGGSGSGSFSGGGDCNTPPVCGGDAAMCGTAVEEWHAMCTAHTDAQNLSTALVGNGQQPPTFVSDQTKYSQGSVWVQPSSGNTQGDQANQGTYNTSGFGFARQCPIQDFSFKAIAVVAPFSKGCDVLQYVGPICVALALFAAACITAGSNR